MTHVMTVTEGTHANVPCLGELLHHRLVPPLA